MAQPYKRYERQERVQTTEENFKKGMKFSTVPLDDGYCNMFVNFDYKEDGEVVIPRFGLKTTKASIHYPKDAPQYVTENVDYNEGLTIYANKECVEENNQKFGQVIYGQLDNTPKIANTELYTGSLNAVTINRNEPEIKFFDEANIFGHCHNNTSLTNYYNYNAKTYFQKPDELIVHGMPLTQTNNMSKHIGCFAWTNSYYYFTTSGKLFRSKYNDKTASSLYKPYHTYKFDYSTVNPSTVDIVFDFSLPEPITGLYDVGVTFQKDESLTTSGTMLINESSISFNPGHRYISFTARAESETLPILGRFEITYYTTDVTETPIPYTYLTLKDTDTITYYDLSYLDINQGNKTYIYPQNHKTTSGDSLPVDSIVKVSDTAYNQVIKVESISATEYKYSMAHYEIVQIDKFGLYEPSEVVSKELTPNEASMWGYNMLDENPYLFEDRIAAGNITLQGIIPYGADGSIKLQPTLNEAIYMRCFYTAEENSRYKIVWDWQESTASAWTNIDTQEIETTSAGYPELKVPFNAPVNNFTIRVQAFRYDTSVNEYNNIAEHVYVVGFNFDKETYGSMANTELQNYSLHNASGMTYWENQLVVYGISQNPTILFVSEINDPSYFPYPNKVDTFEEPISFAIPFMENLLVFTKTKLYMLTMAEDGLSFTKDLIQTNLNINPWDLHLTKTIKNMLFFKSGNYYYMIVPKKNTVTGELVLAPVSKSIEDFLDNFESNIKRVIWETYGYKDDLELIDYYNFLDYESIHNVYTFKTNIWSEYSQKYLYLNVDLIYNSVMRAWHIIIFESSNIIVPYEQDITKPGTLISFWKNGKDIGTPSFQFYEFDKHDIKDFYISDQNILELGYNGNNVVVSYSTEPLQIHNDTSYFRNWQYLDTGFRAFDTDFKKRFREIQFRVSNLSLEKLQFHTEFSIDGDIRQRFYKYEVEHLTDPNDPNYGLIYIKPYLTDPSEVPGTTILAEDKLEHTMWELDSSRFPEQILWKVRVRQSGKGYIPRMRIISRNEKKFELLNFAWVYRNMYSR